MNFVSDNCEKQLVNIYRTIIVPGKRKQDNGNITDHCNKKKHRLIDNSSSSATTKTSQFGMCKEGNKGGSKPGSNKYNKINDDQVKLT